MIIVVWNHKVLEVICYAVIETITLCKNLKFLCLKFFSEGDIWKLLASTLEKQRHIAIFGIYCEMGFLMNLCLTYT